MVARMKLQLLAAVFVLGCGGKNPPPSTASTTAPNPTMSPKPEPPETIEAHIDGYHTLLAARWHMPVGPDRMKGTCGEIDKFRSASGKVSGSLRAHPKAGIETTAAALQLERTIADLEAACGGTDQVAFDAAFGKLHDAFHKVHEMFGKKADGDHPH